MAGLSKEISDSLAVMMNQMAQDSLPEYDSNQLSDIQREIVESEDKNIIVVAGAGSGKTRVLTERIKYLVTQKHVDPSNIVSITFTNMAADEMRERLMNVPGIGDAFIGTIHSFANKIFANSGSEYEIFNDARDNEFHKYLIETYCNKLTMKRYLAYKDAQILVDQGRMSESDLNDFLYPQEQYELYMIEGKYLKASNLEDNDSRLGYLASTSDYPENISTLMKQYNVITFDQLLEEATKYFNDLGSEIEYVLVDEFQDIGRLEYKFIQGLNAINSFYVGDDWQAIYGFKGGNVNIFKSLIRNKSYKTYYLTDNYRSSKKVIELANQVINQVSDKIDKNVNVISENEGNVIIDSKYNLQYYLRKLKDYGEYKDWFILVRTNKEIFRVSGILEKMGIPFSTFKKSDMSLAEMRLEMNNDTVKLLTVHTSKGLESKNVILEGNFPVKQPPYLKNTDERRVMYVGCTRAEDTLILLN